MSFHQASQLLDKLINRAKEGKCTYRQARILERQGFGTDVTFEEASATIDRIAKSKWTLRGDQ